MDFDTILYIIILAASLIIGAIGKSKKEQAGQTAKPNINPANGNNPNKSIIEILKEMQNEEKRFDPIVPKPIEKELKNTQIKNKPVDLDYLDKPVEEEGERTTKTFKTDERNNNKFENLEILANFDAKSALIYSEILNRKYI